MNSPKHADDDTSAALMDGRDDSDDDYASINDDDDDSDSIDDDPYCYGCRRQFTNMDALNQHLFDSPNHNWCFQCSRDFSSEMALLNVSHVHSAFSIPDPSAVASKLPRPSRT